MKGLKRGLLAGLIIAAVVYFLPDSLLGMLTVRSGLAEALPAAAPPLGMKARALLAFAAFLPVFLITFLLLRRRRNEWDVDDDFEMEPLSAAEQMDTGSSFADEAPRAYEPAPAHDPAPAYEPAPAYAPAPAYEPEPEPAPVPGDRLARIEAALAALPAHIDEVLRSRGGGDAGGVLARVEALEAQISERLAAIDGRLAMQGIQGAAGGLRKPAQAEKTIASIRRSLEGKK